jgi:hypothetical protein
MTICTTVKNEIREATAIAMDFCASWTGEDYVGGICDREGIDIQSSEVANIVMEAQQDFNMGIL